MELILDFQCGKSHISLPLLCVKASNKLIKLMTRQSQIKDNAQGRAVFIFAAFILSVMK